VKTKSLEHHPDRGGSVEMVKEYLNERYILHHVFKM